MSKLANGWRILSPNGTYFRGFVPIGPCFGATRDEAMVFSDALSAVRVMGQHWAFGDCEIELPNGKLKSEVPTLKRSKKDGCDA